MKVFISWSGARSKAVAELLCTWIRCVLQGAKPWISTHDIEAGSVWFNEINEQLKDATTGIICLTKGNKDKPWILFEAGALSRGLTSQRVMTFLIDMEPTDVGDPLAQFNAKKPDQQGLRGLVTSINGRLADPLEPSVLERVFLTYWPQFSEQYSAIIADVVEAEPPARTDASKIDEVLQHVRGMDRRIRTLEAVPELARKTKSWADLAVSSGMAASQEKDFLLAEANKIARQLRNKVVSLDEARKVCELEGIPEEFLKMAMNGIMSPLYDGT